MILWLTGLPCSGRKLVAEKLVQTLGAVELIDESDTLDVDEIEKWIDFKEEYTKYLIEKYLSQDTSSNNHVENHEETGKTTNH